MKNLWKGAVFTGTLLFLFSTTCIAQKFDGNRAYRYLIEQCDLGTREPNSPGHTRAKAYFETFLKTKKGVYSHHDFTFDGKTLKTTLKLTNFHILFKGKAPKRHLLCAHWDSRPWADRDPNPLAHNQPVPGANDGASGVAVLMELCNVFSAKPPLRTVEIVLFDGEDFGKEGNTDWCQGSKYFAKQAKPADYSYAILLDMIGDKDLTIKREGNSQARFPWLMEKIWAAARECKADAFLNETGPSIYDDHIPLMEKGIPAADLIDFDYPAWHTLSDTPDKCSPASLQTVGDVILKLIYEE